MASTDLNKAFVTDGRNICDDLTKNNKGDYLTKLVTSEARSIIAEIESLPTDISAVKKAVDNEKERLRIEALKKAQEQEEENESNS